MFSLRLFEFKTWKLFVLKEKNLLLLTITTVVKSKYKLLIVA
jgi:hypothetical protein